MSKMRSLAYRMRPLKIEDVIGQKHLLGENKPIRKMIEHKQLSSIILFGPPGIGKTSIAQSIAGSSDIPFRSLNAVSSGKKDLENVVKEALSLETSLLLYVDEIHRYSKTQIEYLLPYCESSDIILIGSTTESVYHSLPAAILSRSTVFQLKPLSPEEILEGLKRAIKDEEKGLGKFEIDFTDESLLFLAEITGGDMRSALNKLETIVITNAVDNKVQLTTELIENFAEIKHLSYNGESSRYNLMSALQKSIRGSDVDAALYYLAILLESGDLESIFRRLSVCASEDAFANLGLTTHVLSAINVARMTGLPEARIPLAAVVVELALSPKSNSAYKALDAAIELVRSGHSYEPPKHLQDSHYAGAKQLGVKGYKYAHDYKVQKLGAWVNQQYLPDEIKNARFYYPNEVGHEKVLADNYYSILKAKELENQKNNN